MDRFSISLDRGVHRGVGCLFVHFPYNFKFKEHLKQFPGTRWSNTHRSFYIPYSAELEKKLVSHIYNFRDTDVEIKNRTNEDSKVRDSDRRVLPKDKSELLRYFEDYMTGKRYSVSTIRTYTGFISDFLKFNKDRDPSELDGESVRLFIEWAIKKFNYSISTHRQIIGAMKHFAYFFPKCSIDPDTLERPPKQQILPVVLSMEEVMRLLQVTRNLKHKVIIAMLYSSGLRIGELLTLELSSFDFDRKLIHIRSGKGRKDRYTQLADSVVPLIRTYYDAYRPKRYFIEGRSGGQYSPNSLRAFLKNSCKLAGIVKRVTPHTLRHSYATHLLESGTGLRYIQELLGHAKPETTMVYTHVRSHNLTDVMSPLDVMVAKFRDPQKSPNELSFGRLKLPDNNDKN